MNWLELSVKNKMSRNFIITKFSFSLLWVGGFNFHLIGVRLKTFAKARNMTVVTNVEDLCLLTIKNKKLVIQLIVEEILSRKIIVICAIFRFNISFYVVQTFSNDTSTQ